MDAASFNFNFTDPQTLTRLLGLAIPILVGVVAKKIASQGLKATLNAALSAIGGALVYLTASDAHHYNVGGFVNAALNTFVVSIATYYGFWKPSGLAGTVADKTASFGVGPSPVLETDDKGAESPPDAAGTPEIVGTAAGLPVPAKKATPRKRTPKKPV